MLSACSGSQSGENPLLANLAAPPSGELRANCDLVRVKCTGCHTIDRILRADPGSPKAWERYVDRMRRQPGSGITIKDEDPILQCLVYRSFGADGLAEWRERD